MLSRKIKFYLYSLLYAKLLMKFFKFKSKDTNKPTTQTSQQGTSKPDHTKDKMSANPSNESNNVDDKKKSSK
jgi:hypothetical protein